MNNKHPLIEQYLDDICRQLKARELRKEIRRELEGHLEELVWEKREQGMDEEAAARFALSRMGDSTAVAMGLNRVHKRRVPWGMFGWLAVLITVALITMYAIDLSYAAMPSSYLANTNLFLGKVTFTCAGVIVLFVVSRIDYRKLLDFSWLLYGGTVLLMTAAVIWGPQVNGARNYLKLGAFSIDMIGISPYLLLTAAAGLLARQESNRRGLLVQMVAFIALPVLLYVKAPSFSALVMYVVAYLVLLVISGRSRRIIVPQVLAFFSIVAGYILAQPSGQSRIDAFLRRYDVSADEGWMYIQIDNAIRSAGWQGHGFAAVNQRLPYSYSDTVFTYIIYSFGWLAGAFVLFSVLVFITRLMKMALQVRDHYGKLLVAGLGALFTFQFVWNIGMSLGVLPIISISFPFVSYGGSHLLVQLAAIGMICSVYLRKDMIRVIRAK